MSNKAIYAIIIIAVSAFWAGILTAIWTYLDDKTPQRIDCSVSEFHPDYTPKMREQCRAARKTT